MSYVLVYDYIRMLGLFVCLYAWACYMLNKGGATSCTTDVVWIVALLTLAIRLFIGTYVN